MIAASVAAAGLLWAAVLGMRPSQLSASSAIAVSIGFLLTTVISVAGLLLVRAPWSRWLALATVVAGPVAFAVLGGDLLFWIGTCLSAIAIVGLVGPWLRVWLRRRPTPDQIGWIPPTLVLGGVALVPLVGLCSPAGLALPHGVLAACGLLLAWGYARAELWGLWGFRAILLPAGAATVVTSPAGAVVLLTAAATLTALAWTPSARRAIGIPAPVLPAPRIPKAGDGAR